MSTTWSRILAATWVLVAVAHGFVSVASRRTGKPIWWIDDKGLFGNSTPAIGAAIVYLAMLAALVTALRRGAFAPILSIIVAAGLGASACIDLAGSTGAAVVALGVSFAALLGAVASLAGRESN